MKQTLLDWLGTFWKVTISPTPQTFLKESNKADGKFPSALGWLVVCAVYLIVIASIAEKKLIDGSTLLAALFMIPLAVVLFATALNFIALRMSRQKAYIYDKLIYITVSIFLPGFVVFVPFSGLMSLEVFAITSFILFSYQIVLLVIAVKAIVILQLWQALVAVALSIVAGIVITPIIFILLASIISPNGINPQ